MDPVGDLALLASPDPRVRLAAEERLRQAGPRGVEALERLTACEGVPEGLRNRAQDLAGTLLGESAVRAFSAAVPEFAEPDLWAGAVAIAAERHVSLDAAALSRRLDDLVEGARRAVPPDAAVPDRVGRLAAYLHGDLGFRGNAEAYGDPRNSYLPDVLDRRLGIPVTLAVLWIAVGSRIGLRVSGVGLPLHFVARCECEAGPPVFIDAFHGTVLDRDGCVRLVARAAGREVRLPDRAFRPLRSRDILVRMLKNLRGIHEAAGNLHGALAAVDRILRLAPLDPGTWRERAALLARLSRWGAAARAVSRALALDPSAPDRATLETFRRELQRAAAALN